MNQGRSLDLMQAEIRRKKGREKSHRVEERRFRRGDSVCLRNEWGDSLV